MSTNNQHPQRHIKQEIKNYLAALIDKMLEQLYRYGIDTNYKYSELKDLMDPRNSRYLPLSEMLKSLSSYGFYNALVCYTFIPLLTLFCSHLLLSLCSIALISWTGLALTALFYPTLNQLSYGLTIIAHESLRMIFEFIDAFLIMSAHCLKQTLLELKDNLIFISDNTRWATYKTINTLSWLCRIGTRQIYNPEDPERFKRFCTKINEAGERTLRYSRHYAHEAGTVLLFFYSRVEHIRAPSFRQK